MSDIERRRLLAAVAAAGAAIPVVAACGGDDSTSPGSGTNTDDTSAPEETPTPPEEEEENDTPTPEETSQGGGNALAKTSEIPVGGGKIISAQKVVVTQPTAGDFKCFSAICTHKGCPVRTVEGGTINCTCHGSKFKIADGSVANGPATQPLAATNIKVDGDSITLA